MSLKNFSDLFTGDTSYGTPYPPPHTPRPTPAPRKFDIFEGENNDLLNIFGNESFLENELNVHFQDFENGM